MNDQELELIEGSGPETGQGVLAGHIIKMLEALDNGTLIWHRSPQASWRQLLHMTVLRYA
ncbi:MAG: hypothetical protein OXF73_06995 [Gammaproteobacteria bacterium]|nr:hypothetical protein [Gammaproteobacteria bacterium]MCY4226378.1 hypothetical protein [Gammaproteobacteria bacterium]